MDSCNRNRWYNELQSNKWPFVAVQLLNRQEICSIMKLNKPTWEWCHSPLHPGLCSSLWESIYTTHNRAHDKSSAHSEAWVMLHDWGDSVPCDQARELSRRGRAIRASVFQAEQQHADEQSLTSLQRNVVFNREKELLWQCIPPERALTEGSVNSCSISAVI